ncbi:SpoIIE family protein phosphatase [Streptomyces sp. bgisy130]|uniref:SpoIIE family protein phosphatase n=1 Tax=Streptomyces sp. bgisy130 TaxID=3413788 RepID=UPI003F49C8B5
MVVAAAPLGGEQVRWVLTGAVMVEAGEPDALDLLVWAAQQGPFALVIHDAELRYVWVSEEWRRLFDLPGDDQVLGRHFREVRPELFYTEAESGMRQVLASGQPQLREVRTVVPGQASDRAWAISFSPLKDARGVVHAVCVTAVETTERYWARRWLSMLSEAGTRVGTSLDIIKTATELAEMVIPRFADIATVDLLDSVFRGDEPTVELAPGAVALRRVAHRANSPGIPMGAELGETQSYPDYSPPARCIAGGRGLLSAEDDPGFIKWIKLSPYRTAALVSYGMRSIVAVPLQARGTILGVLMCGRSRPEAFTEGHLQVAEELAARAALSLDNARRYTRERTTAIALQRSLLPRRPPKGITVDVATRYLPHLPADFRMCVGGDWFDVIPLSGARVALVVGDVIGHGIRASATMARLRGAVRTLADVDLPPDEVLTHLDDLVIQLSAESGDETGADEDAEGVGATCLYAVYDPVRRQCTMATAGHPPPVVVLPDGTASTPDLLAGPPLGVGGLPFEYAEVNVPEGSMLVLFTDGLIQSRTRDADARLGELCRALTLPAPTLEALCDVVLKAMLVELPADDVALLIARTRALDPSQVATWDVPADPAAVATARENVLLCLAEWRLEELAFGTELIVSELVTNAIRYGRPPIQLRLIRSSALICEVSDTSDTAPHLRRAHVFDEGGRGLFLVAQLSQRWGSRHTPQGKTIWCEQNCGTS